MASPAGATSRRAQPATSARSAGVSRAKNEIRASSSGRTSARAAWNAPSIRRLNHRAWTKARSVKLALAGDTMLGRNVAEAILGRGPDALVADELVAVAHEADLFVL